MNAVNAISAKAFAIAAFVAFGIALSAPYFPERFSDVRAFYCAGQAVLRHADPYREHPLGDCERRVTAPALSVLRSGVTVPAPFPGYVLASFALLAMLPFGWALALWFVGTVAALTLAAGLIARMTQTPLAAVAILVGFPAVTVALPLGQLTPFVLLAIAGTGTLLQAGRPRLAALAALGAMLEPHVGLALVVGIAAAIPRTRLTVLAGLATLAAIGGIVSGRAVEWEYLSTVLPAHALANVADSMQFSTTNFAYVAGVPARVALVLGSLWYGLALITGTVVALKLRARFGIVSVAFIPPAFVVFGGPHTHLAQLAMAIPAFLLACARAREAERAGLTALTFVAAIPWLGIAPFPLLFPATAVLAIAFARTMHIERQALRIAVASLATLAAVFIAIVRSHTERGTVVPRVVGNPLAEVAWQVWVLARNLPPEPWYLFAKAPTVIAFCLLLGVLVHAACERRPTGSAC